MSDLQKERKIPVFTVWKNNTILKNIFIVNTPPTFDQQQQTNNNIVDQNHELCGETFLVGRHPDCDIRLEHPSISRTHLRIHSLPSSKLLFLTDLNSVHGTWVSGKRIEPNIRTIIKEGNDLRIGGSSRVYKLHWIPLSQAYDVSQPFVPPLDFQDPQEDEDEPIQDEDLLGSQNEEVIAVDNICDATLKSMESLDICDEDEMSTENIAHKAPLLQPQKLQDVDFEEDELIKDEDLPGTKHESIAVDNCCADDTLKSLESQDICHGDETSVENLAPDMPPLLPQKLEDVDFESLESLCLDDISLEVEMKETHPVSLTQFDDCASEDGQSVDSVLEGLVPLFKGESWEHIGIEENYLPYPFEDPGFASSVLEGLNSWCLDEKSELLAQHNPSTPLLPENSVNPTPQELANTTAEAGSEFASELLDVQDGTWNFWYGSHQAPSSDATLGALDSDFRYLGIENEKPENEPAPKEHFEKASFGSTAVDLNSSVKDHHERELWSFWSRQMGNESGSSVVSDAELFLESETKSSRNEYQSSPLSSLKRQTCSPVVTSELEAVRSLLSRRGNPGSIFSSLPDAESFSDSENVPCVEDYQSPRPLASVENRIESPVMKSEPKGADSIWSRRGKLASAPQVMIRTEEKKIKDQKSVKHEPFSRVLFDGRDDQDINEENEVFTPDKENFTPTTHKSMRKSALLNELAKSNSGRRLLSKTADSPNKHSGDILNVKQPLARALKDDLEVKEEEEVFTPDKENFTPNTHKSMRKSTLLNELAKSNTGKRLLSKMADSPNKHPEDVMSPSSDKENDSPKSLLMRKNARLSSVKQVESVRLNERKEERMPFQPLMLDSPRKRVSEGCTPCLDNTSTSSVTSGSCDKVKFKDAYSGCGEKTQQWNMVVDTTTLLSKQSRKALQLLEGLQGTQLIIPRIVIAELASLKRQVSFFRRNTEVLSPLEWIQDCMVKRQGWIRVQNSMEEGRPVAPTPPASPHSQCSYAFSALESRRELQSPTMEDDVLDYALNLRTFKYGGQLILLSDDVTLKVKAMAEGMICETAEEFRESLVNPFSERFRWTDSSPRGQTWSCSDDIVLKEKFYPSSLKMTPKAMENAKGLKLILMHNSRYFERMR